LVTNVSADHFGEYGVDDLDALAEAKLVVARALDARGWLVLNADDALLRRHGPAAAARTAWFAREATDAWLHDARARGAQTCGGLDGRLCLVDASGVAHDLGALASMPLTLGGAAPYNAANLAGAALLAACLGVAPAAIASVCARFGTRREDNPGRLERWRVGGAEVLLDYAHNPDGLAGLLAVAAQLRAPDGRLLLMLGQAGNRGDAAIVDLARVAAAARPARVALKDIAGYMRGRAEGDVAAVIAGALVQAGVPPEALMVELDEVAAARALVDAARAGDGVVLPVHNLAARAELGAWLDARAGDRGG
jgi:UDP-N-acetylmuramyl tripeptide synthase